MPQPHLRAADTDRAAVATVLGEHMSAGRLTLDEYDERLTRAYAARTFGELEALTADLPPVSTGRAVETAPHTEPAPAPAAGAATWQGADPHSWRSWMSTSLIVIAIWATISLASWELLYFWPVWVIGPWGAVLLAQTLMGGTDDGGKRRQLGT
ncbi:DUF1707 domain-containing protein [Blastococcus sp. CT_GayMR19]|uniref:DUF1707 SHOCT-like domain-containing protein n=1 Tax=Blastococcus sp. CT_GayMR19 TaxID=2559608 RepID=UPI001073A237|nr:DUF1707 domain-containing protein [Blastococcus sp. CT_GayMR19]TFV72916.1 DUF1707 domain-containing protein [Blastococcus sp. CT_GayMR19]